MDEETRQLETAKASRIRWPKAMMEKCPSGKPTVDSEVVWWKQRHRKSIRIYVALSDFSYVVVIDERKEFVLPWTAFPVEFKNQRRRRKQHFEEYWNSG